MQCCRTSHITYHKSILVLTVANSKPFSPSASCDFLLCQRHDTNCHRKASAAATVWWWTTDTWLVSSDKNASFAIGVYAMPCAHGTNHCRKSCGCWSSWSYVLISWRTHFVLVTHSRRECFWSTIPVKCNRPRKTDGGLSHRLEVLWWHRLRTAYHKSNLLSRQSSLSPTYGEEIDIGILPYTRHRLWNSRPWFPSSIMQLLRQKLLRCRSSKVRPKMTKNQLTLLRSFWIVDYVELIRWHFNTFDSRHQISDAPSYSCITLSSQSSAGVPYTTLQLSNKLSWSTVTDHCIARAVFLKVRYRLNVLQIKQTFLRRHWIKD